MTKKLPCDGEERGGGIGFAFSVVKRGIAKYVKGEEDASQKSTWLGKREGKGKNQKEK